LKLAYGRQQGSGKLNFDAFSLKRIWKARWIRVRYEWALGKTLGLQSIAGIVKQLIGALKRQ